MKSKKAIHTGVKFNGIKGGYYCMMQYNFNDYEILYI